jgi:hypothetical protein
MVLRRSSTKDSPGDTSHRKSSSKDLPPSTFIERPFPRGPSSEYAGGALHRLQELGVDAALARQRDAARARGLQDAWGSGPGRGAGLRGGSPGNDPRLCFWAAAAKPSAPLPRRSVRAPPPGFEPPTSPPSGTHRRAPAGPRWRASCPHGRSPPAPWWSRPGGSRAPGGQGHVAKAPHGARAVSLWTTGPAARGAALQEKHAEQARALRAL